MGLKVLSLFDGMSCGQLALQRLGIEVDAYYASEIDKYAIQVTQANFPETIQVGDVCELKAEDYQDVDLILAGSPCQGFSFAGKQLAFDDPRSALFFEFVRLLKEIKPKYFLLENVRMKQQFQDVITEQVSACYPDFEGGDLLGSQIKPILINSALLSAQNRQRLYWTNIPNIEQPKDKGIVLIDILEDDVEDHYLAGEHLQNNYQGGNQLNPNYKSQANTIHDTNKKSGVICAGTHGYANGYVETKPKVAIKNLPKGSSGKSWFFEQQTYLPDSEKTRALKSGSGSGNIPKIVETKPSKKEYISKKSIKKYVENKNAEFNDPYNKKTIKGDKSTSLRTNSSNGNMWVNEKAIRETKPKQVDNREPKVAVEYKAMTEVRTPEANKIRREHKKKTGKDWSPREMRHLIERDDDKMNALTSALTKQHIVQEKKQLIEEERIVVDKEKKQLLIAEATKKGYTVIEDGDCFDINFPNSKTRRGRNMKYKCNALTTASQNFMRFENLSWRKLTPLECERLQTVPDNYTNHVSNTQRYKMLGNGWTVDVIAHILNNMEL